MKYVRPTEQTWVPSSYRIALFGCVHRSPTRLGDGVPSEERDKEVISKQ